MITLYELHWSHYCEKVRLALNYMQIEWRSVGINAFTKAQLQAFALPPQLPNLTVPAIYDSATGASIMDSTPILRYLAAHYPASPALFPGDDSKQAAIDRKLIELDTCLALPARRLAYGQLILESPSTLADLFLANIHSGIWCKPILRTVAGHALGMMLTKRFSFDRCEAQGTYEALESYLFDLARAVARSPFLVGEQLCAADLALAAQLRPLTIVPFFAEHPELRALFDHCMNLRGAYGGAALSAYERAILAARRLCSPYRRRVRSDRSTEPVKQISQEFAANDQLPIWDLAILALPYRYLRGLRRGKRRRAMADSKLR